MAMGWSRRTSLALVLMPTAIGFTTAILNPINVGLSSKLAGVSVTSGMGYRILIFMIITFAVCMFLIKMAKDDEKSPDDQPLKQELSLSKDDRRLSRAAILVFGIAFAVVLIFSVVPALADLGISMIAMALAFVVGTLIVSVKLINQVKIFGSAFVNGMKSVAPSILIVVTAFSIKYIAEQSHILYTMFHVVSTLLGTMSPYIGVLVLLVFILVIEFFIPSATAKASLLIPILTLAPIPGISKTVIILAYLLGDGYTNVFYPTCGTLVIGLGIAGVSYYEWIKKTFLFQLFLLASSIVFLWGALLLDL